MPLYYFLLLLFFKLFKYTIEIAIEGENYDLCTIIGYLFKNNLNAGVEIMLIMIAMIDVIAIIIILIIDTVIANIKRYFLSNSTPMVGIINIDIRIE